MAGFFNDTSGMDATAFNGSSNNAASDFARHNMADPGQFKSPLVDRLLRQPPPSGASAPAAPTATASPNTPPQAAGPPPPAISSGGSLVGRILRSASGPPSYDASGQALVPGTPFTPQQFAQQILAAQQPPPEVSPLGGGDARLRGPLPPFQGIPQFRGPNPPNRQAPGVLDGLADRTRAWFAPGQSPPQAPGSFPPPPPADAMPPPPQPPQPPPPYTHPVGWGPNPSPNPFTRHSDMLMRGLPALTDPRFPLMPSRGFFRGGDVPHLRRGGLPRLMMGLPERMNDGGGYVPPDGMGDGRSDHVDAKLSPGEFVQDAETVSLLGNGDNSAGARGMEAIRETIRREKGKQLVKGKFSSDAKSPEHYARVGMRAAAKKRS